MESERFEKALIYATRLQVNRNGTAIAYISHLLAVSGIAIEYGAASHSGRRVLKLIYAAVPCRPF